MLTVGGAISGYSETGRARCTSAPAMVMMIDSTAAKIGRSMKKCEKRMALLGPRRTGCLTAWISAAARGVDDRAARRTNGLARPPITTRSLGTSPDATTRSPRAMPPSVTGLAATLLSAPTT